MRKECIGVKREGMDERLKRRVGVGENCSRNSVTTKHTEFRFLK